MIAPVGPLGIAALLGLAALGLVLDEPALAADPANGELLAGLAGCGACHTADGGAPYAGGGPIETRFGTFRATNLTPDPEHGLGGWTERDFARAMRDGRAPDGHAYWPVFPYPAFSGLTDADLADLWAYLRTVPPSATEPDAGRLGLWAWRTVVLRRERPPEPEALVGAVDRGRYLVEVVGHCGDCHSRRTSIGGVRRREHLAGNDQPPHPGPNLTPHADGLGGWSDSEVDDLLTLGMEPDGDFAGGGMRHVIRDGTSKLTDADRAAIVAYLRSVPPEPTPPSDPASGD